MIEAILEAMRDTILQRLDLTLDACDIQPDGHPAPDMGDFYISLDEGAVTCADPKVGLKEAFDVRVFLTVRAGIFPADRRGTAYLATCRYLSELERKVIAALNGREEVRELANQYLGISATAQQGDDTVLKAAARLLAPGGQGEYGGQFILPMFYTGRGATEPRGADWIDGQEGAFLVRVLRFSGGLRIASFENQK